MGLARLTEFYRNVTAWPKSKAELSAIAERTSQLLEVPFAGIDLDGDNDKIAAKAGNGVVSDSVSPELVEEMLKNQLKRMDQGFLSGAAGMQIKQIQISRDTSPLATVLPISHLTITPIPKPLLSPDNGVVPDRRRRDPGYLIVGSAKPLSEKEQTLLIAAAQRLSELSAIARLEAALQLRSQFLSIASHELKTPLTSIYGILQLQERMVRMKKDKEIDATPGDEKKQSFLKIVIRQVERLNELIDGLLDVSRIQNGRFTVEPAEVDVAMILRETVNARLALIAKEAGVALNLDAPEVLMAFVDPVRIEEVVTNLVMNAIRFSPEGGVIWVKLRGEGGSLRLTVRDQGPIVPVEDRERIFQPFERAHRTSRLGGLGLGLFISRQIAQLHGGNVSLVESVPGKGNVFEAYFPESSAVRSLSAASA